MDSRFWIELLGYIGSAIVLISFMMSNVIRLRIINTIGSLLSATYSLIVHAYPVMIMNLALAAINLYYIYKMKTASSTTYHTVWTDRQDGSLTYLVKENQEDIARFWHQNPQEALEKSNLAGIIYADGTPAALFAAIQNGDSAEILLDYALPAYRDTSAGAYLYTTLQEKGIREVWSALQGGQGYLDKLGFIQEKGIWKKNLNS